LTALKKLTHVTIWVHDQEEALAFYTEKLGMEIRNDTVVPEMGDFRWLSVGLPAQPEVEFVLIVPGPPVVDGDVAAQLKDLVAKGVVGSLHVSTDDCRASYEQLKARGVEFSMEPTEMPYGIDAQLRDPSGNQIRLTQPLNATETGTES
jgi:catechol 2,3-dioxygenase-like lactoylglutathione lyase family enzyme